jgi:glucosyl-dolichyl phosphate glucuronosyltransferase
VQLTAIICTYDRYRLAEACVATILSSRSYDPAAVEVLVVDNTPPARRRPMAVPNSVRVVPCDTPGLSVARNAGIAAAAGEIVGFVDDDARVHDDWCLAVRRAFRRHRSAEACGGRTLPLH